MTISDDGSDRLDDAPDPVWTFWESARISAGINDLASFVGTSPTEAVIPPTFSFGDTPELADELCGLVLSGVKTGTATAMAEFETTDEPVPAVGDLWIVTDGSGQPRALIRTVDVAVVPFDEVSADFAAAEGEDDRTLESWRVEHERYFRRVLGDAAFSSDMPILTETFELLYP